jgi:glycosyltransferase involved in cell wall biosynthesis
VPPSFTVTLAARLVRWKGQAVFIRAAALAARRLPRLRFQIVGSASPEDERPGPLGGGPSYERELRHLAVSLGLEGTLSFQPFREPAALFDGTSLAVHASLLPEPFGRVVVQAMAAGLPVVAVRGGGIPEIVINGQTGRLVPAGDVDALAEAILALAGDRERCRALGKAGRARAEAQYSLEKMVSGFEAVWLEAMN